MRTYRIRTTKPERDGAQTHVAGIPVVLVFKGEVDIEYKPLIGFYRYSERPYRIAGTNRRFKYRATALQALIAQGE